MALEQEDRFDITNLTSRYGLLIDSRRFDEWSELWEPDASIDVPGRGPIETEEARRKLVMGSPPGVHLVAAPVVEEGGGPGTASVEQSFVFHNLATGQLMAGWYEDSLVKRDGRWYFARRAIHYFGEQQEESVGHS